jgi:hypothetical protein
LAVTQTMLDQAIQALHDLRIGKAVVEFRDQNGEVVRYSRATAGDLAAYIEELKRQLGLLTVSTGPMRVWF